MLRLVQNFRELLLCDVTLIADNVEIPAHKMVLAACSPYFYAMFTSFEESKQDKITLKEIDSQALTLLVEYVYTSEVQVTEENVQVRIIFIKFEAIAKVYILFCRCYYQLQIYYN